MAVSIAETCKCWCSLPYVLCWQIVCWFCLLIIEICQLGTESSLI